MLWLASLEIISLSSFLCLYLTCMLLYVLDNVSHGSCCRQKTDRSGCSHIYSIHRTRVSSSQKPSVCLFFLCTESSVWACECRPPVVPCKRSTWEMSVEVFATCTHVDLECCGVFGILFAKLYVGQYISYFPKTVNSTYQRSDVILTTWKRSKV